MALKNTKMKFRKMVARCMVAAGMILAAGMTDVKVDSADTPSSIEDAKETVDVAPETEEVSVYYYTPEESVFHPEASTVEAATTEATTENVSSTSPDNPECPECDGYYLNESKGKAVATEEVSDTEAFKLTVSDLPDESPAVSDDRNNNKMLDPIILDTEEETTTVATTEVPTEIPTEATTEDSTSTEEEEIPGEIGPAISRVIDPETGEEIIYISYPNK